MDSSADNELSETFDKTVEIRSSEALVFPKLSKSDFLKLTTVVLRSVKLVNLPYENDIPFINVVHLDLSDNSLFDLPMRFNRLNKLQTLILSENQFERIPQSMGGGYSALKHLYVSSNKLERVRCNMTCLQRLQLLDLQNNYFEDFPDSLLSINCKSLSDLNISNNNVFRYEAEKRVDDILGDVVPGRNICCIPIVHTLKRLTLSNCQLTEPVSEILLLFHNLQELNISNTVSLAPNNSSLKQKEQRMYNFLVKLPLFSMANMKHLSILRASRVSLRDFSNEISNFKNLRILECNNNEMNWLPNSFCDLKNLEVCDLSNNVLYCLPDNIGNLSNLSVFLVSSNQLTDLPENFGELKNLKFLDLFFNEFSNVPNVLLSMDLQGVDLENNYFDSSLIKLKNADYSKLLKYFRDEYQLNRMSGFRHEVNESQIDETSSDVSSDSSQSTSVEKQEGNVQDLNCASFEELWSVEEDEDDDFNANDIQLPMYYTRNVPPFRKRREFLCRQSSPPVEGQFDDAESD